MKKIVDFDNGGGMCLGGTYLTTLTPEQLASLPDAEEPSNVVLELAKLGFSADDIIKLKQQGVL